MKYDFIFTKNNYFLFMWASEPTHPASLLARAGCELRGAGQSGSIG